MAQCVIANATGQLELSSADPCVGLVVLTPAEYGLLAANPFLLSPEDGALVSGAILAVWIGGWGIRRAIDALRSGDGNDD
jgi:hypothetical protein